MCIIIALEDGQLALPGPRAFPLRPSRLRALAYLHFTPLHPSSPLPRRSFRYALPCGTTASFTWAPYAAAAAETTAKWIEVCTALAPDAVGPPIMLRVDISY